MTLEQEMRQLLARMSLLQYGSVTAWAPTGREVAGSRPPSGSAKPLVDQWVEKWERDPSQRTIDGARAELNEWIRRATPAQGDDSTLEDWVLTDGEGFAVAQVAGKFGIAEARVRRIRLKNGRESEFGAVIDHSAEKDRSEERVLNLAARGCSWRQIADQTGLHKTQVQRILARRRNAA